MLDRMIITSIDEVFTVDSPVGRQLEMRNRDSFGITFCYGGRITYCQKGVSVISDRGHMVLLPKGRDYSLYGDATGLFPVINVQCTPEFTIEAPISFPLSHPEVYLKQYEQLRELFPINKNRAKCFAILYDMISGISAENAGGNRIAAGAVSYIEQNYSDPTLNNSMIASHLGISEVYFRRVFREYFAVTPKQYILDMRNKKARQLLAEGLLPINKIAENCGFASVYHFSRAFRQSAGLSPTEYRNHMKKVII